MQSPKSSDSSNKPLTCPNCGSPIGEIWQLCPSCGFDLTPSKFGKTTWDDGSSEASHTSPHDNRKSLPRKPRDKSQESSSTTKNVSFSKLFRVLSLIFISLTLIYIFISALPQLSINQSQDSTRIASTLRTPTQTSTKTPTSTSTPTATKTKAPTPTPSVTFTPIPQSSILFQDDFQDGNAKRWDSSVGTWTVIKDETGNYVYEGTGPDNYPQTWPGNRDWADYAFESRIRIKEGTVFVLVRANGSSFYNVSLNTSDVSLARWNSKIGEYKVMKSVSYPIRLNKWYLVRIEIVGQKYTLYLDNKLVTSYTFESDSPVITGGIGYYIGGGETVQVDDVRVWTLK